MPAENYCATEQAINRDPRQAPWGLLSGGSFVMDSVRVFLWFETLADLANHLIQHLPESYEFEEDDLAAYQARVAPLAIRVKDEGLTPGLLAELNAAIKDNLIIDWWGCFDELVAGETEFARELASGFLGATTSSRALEGAELDGFVDYLKTCYC
jgi:hypothetical protein